MFEGVSLGASASIALASFSYTPFSLVGKLSWLAVRAELGLIATDRLCEVFHIRSYHDHIPRIPTAGRGLSLTNLLFLRSGQWPTLRKSSRKPNRGKRFDRAFGSALNNSIRSFTFMFVPPLNEKPHQRGERRPGLSAAR